MSYKNPGNSSLKCPQCGGGGAGVYDSRGTERCGAGVIWRRRKCRSCAHRWSTFEISEGDISRVAVKDVRAVLARLVEDALDAYDETVGRE